MPGDYEPYDPDRHKFTDRREGEWHLDKRVPLTLIISVVVLIGGQLVVYGQTTERFKSLQEKMRVATEDRIHKETALQMFENRDKQLEAINNDIGHIKKDVREMFAMTQHLSHELLRGAASGP